ncbi:hypothetical protein G6F26_014148 [Rhizopus arrhizus]|nr:hypothetical protein G6F26_014148 [Rhizopus arrhizus]
MLIRGSVVLQELHNAHLRVHDDLSLGSDHSPLSLSCLVPPPPPPSSHPRLLWNLSRLSEHDCTYVQLFKDKIRPFLQLLQEYTSADGVYTSVRPDLDALTHYGAKNLRISLLVGAD